MRNKLLAIAIAMGTLATSQVLAAPPPIVHRDTKPENAYVYLGTCEHDAWSAPHFDGLVDCPDIEHLATVLRLVARQGMVLRASPSPSSVELARLHARAEVQLLRVHRTDREGSELAHYWGEVARPRGVVLLEGYLMRGDLNGDAGGDQGHVLAATPARDGFTGRSGYGPARGGNCGGCDLNGDCNNGGELRGGGATGGDRPLLCHA